LEAPDVTPGMARELRKRVAVLQAEIAKLSRKGGANDA
jgi:hypothetical protein